MKEKRERSKIHKNKIQTNYSNLYFWMFRIQFYSRSQVAVKQFFISKEGKLYNDKNQYEHLGC